MTAIALRSYLSVGTATVVGAAAIALVSAGPAATPLPATVVVSSARVALDASAIPAGLLKSIVAEFVAEASPDAQAAGAQILAYLDSAVAGLVSGPDSVVTTFATALAAIPSTIVAGLLSGKIFALPGVITAALNSPVTGFSSCSPARCKTSPAMRPPRSPPWSPATRRAGQLDPEGGRRNDSNRDQRALRYRDLSDQRTGRQSPRAAAQARVERADQAVATPGGTRRQCSGGQHADNRRRGGSPVHRRSNRGRAESGTQSCCASHRSAGGRYASCCGSDD